MMVRKLAFVLMSIFIVSCSDSSVDEQSVSEKTQGPSKEETWEYIYNDNIKLLKEVAKNTSYYNELSFDLNACLLKSVSGDSDPHIRTIPLKEIDPAEIYLDDYDRDKGIRTIFIKCKNKEECIDRRYKKVPDWTPSNYETIDSLKPEKIKKALVHLVKLCGGTPELF